MTPDELLDAYEAELKEYGEIFIPLDEIDIYPQGFVIGLADSLRARFEGDTLIMTYSMESADRGYKLKRTESEQPPRWSGPPPDDAEYDHQRNSYHWTRGKYRYGMTAEEAVRHMRQGARSSHGIFDESHRYVPGGYRMSDMADAAAKVAEAFRNMKMGFVPHEGTEQM